MCEISFDRQLGEYLLMSTRFLRQLMSILKIGKRKYNFAPGHSDIILILHQHKYCSWNETSINFSLYAFQMNVKNFKAIPESTKWWALIQIQKRERTKVLFFSKGPPVTLCDIWSSYFFQGCEDMARSGESVCARRGTSHNNTQSGWVRWLHGDPWSWELGAHTYFD